MRSMFNTLELARRALQTQRAALDVTAHNIANANTPGYTRQAPRIVTTNPYTIPEMNTSVTAGQPGTGSRLETINRVRDQFLDFQYRGEAKMLGEWEEVEQRLSRIETIFNEPSDNSLRSVMDEFFNAWQELSKDPQSLSARSLVRQQTKSLASVFTQTNKLLVQTKENAEADLEMKVNNINTITTQIADLNDRIAVAQLGGNKPNDLLDKRDHLIDQLSEMGEVKVEELSRDDDIDNIRVSFEGIVDDSGTEVAAKWILVDDRKANTLTKTADGYKVYDEEGNEQVETTASNTANTSLNESISGRIGGTLIAQDRVDHYRQQLDALAEGLSTAVNNQINQGYFKDVSGNMVDFSTHFPGDPKELILFDANSDEYMVLNPDFEGEVGISYLPTAAGVPDAANIIQPPDTNNGDNALAIAKLRDKDISGLGDANFFDYYNSTIAALGVETQEAVRLVESQDLLVNQIDQNRMSISSVSVDEEMTNMIKYQHAYNAAARMVTAFDEMLDIVVNRMGIVGR